MRSDEALDRLHGILAQPEFQTERSRTWWDRLLSPISETLRDLIGQFFQQLMNAVSGREGWIGWAGLVVAALILGAGLLFLTRAIRLAVVRESRLRDASAAQRHARSDQLFQEAQRLAAAGHFAEAARVAYLSALYALDERAVLRVQSALTNREHAGQLSRQHPELGEMFAALVQRYDRLRYGGYAVSPDGFAELSGLVERARARALQPPA